jgi:insulysin
MSQVAEEGHPVKKFGTGNKETLSGDNRPALLAFYQKYYAASRMKLAMLSNLSLRVQ